MRIDIGTSPTLRIGAVGVTLLGLAAWVQVGALRWGSLGAWLCGVAYCAFLAVAAALVGAMRGRRPRPVRLVLLGHADARLYWRADSLWRWQNAGRPGVDGMDGAAAIGVDDVCIVETVQWGGACLWLTVCVRYPEAAEPPAWVRRGRPDRARLRLCIFADAVPAARFHALCARCQAMRRGAGFLSPW